MSKDPHPNGITKEEALKLLDETEEIGLVHSSTNVVNEINYVCNCCGCCCGMLQGLAGGLEGAMVKANYYAEVDLNYALAVKHVLAAAKLELVPLKTMFLLLT